jgi:hypothetical protein
MMVREVSIRSEIAVQLLSNTLLYVNTRKKNGDLRIRIVVNDTGIDYDDLPLLLTTLSYAGVRGRVASLVYRTHTHDIIEFIQYWVKGTGAVEAYIYKLEARDEDQAKRKIKEEITDDPLDIKVDDRYRFEAYIFDKEMAKELFMPRVSYWLQHTCKNLLKSYNEQIDSVVFHGIEAMLGVALNKPKFNLLHEAYKHLGNQVYTISILQRVLAVSPYIIQQFPQDEDVKHIYNDLMRVIELSRRLKDPDPIFSRELSKEEAERIRLKDTGLPSQIFIRPLIKEIRYRTEDGTVVYVGGDKLDIDIIRITLPLYREAYSYCRTLKENDDIIKEIDKIVRPHILAIELTS